MALISGGIVGCGMMMSVAEGLKIVLRLGTPLTNLGRRLHGTELEIAAMSWLAVLLASIGAALILGALTFVSALIGGLITAMIVLMCGPLIDRLIARRNRRSV
jgi:hypothetical protein